MCFSKSHFCYTNFLCNHAPSFYPGLFRFHFTCRWTHFMFRQSTPAEVVQFREQVWISLPFLFSLPFLLFFTSLNSSPSSFSLSLLLAPTSSFPVVSLLRLSFIQLAMYMYDIAVPISRHSSAADEAWYWPKCVLRSG